MLTSAEAAARLKVCKRKLWKLPIPFVDVGTARRQDRRYREEDVEAWLRSGLQYVEQASRRKSPRRRSSRIGAAHVLSPAELRQISAGQRGNG
jgi:hypothetical protein